MPSTAFSVNGLVELLPLNNEFLIAMERSFSVGVPGTATRSSSTASRCQARPTSTVSNASPAASTGSGRHKTLLLDLDTLGIPLDNIEG